jgi:hypothetical protein
VETQERIRRNRQGKNIREKRGGGREEGWVRVWGWGRDGRKMGGGEGAGTEGKMGGGRRNGRKDGGREEEREVRWAEGEGQEREERWVGRRGRNRRKDG